MLQLDGHTASWRFQFLLASHSLVLKQWSYYREYYYAGLEPGVHYLPFWTRSAACARVIVLLVCPQPR